MQPQQRPSEDHAEHDDGRHPVSGVRHRRERPYDGKERLVRRPEENPAAHHVDREHDRGNRNHEGEKDPPGPAPRAVLLFEEIHGSPAGKS
jgi:hypothetical protein